MYGILNPWYDFFVKKDLRYLDMALLHCYTAYQIYVEKKSCGNVINVSLRYLNQASYKLMFSVP